MAESYIDTLHLSKAGLLDQITSGYGSQFEEANAKWTIDQLDLDRNEQAVLHGETYVETLNHSNAGPID